MVKTKKKVLAIIPSANLKGGGELSFYELLKYIRSKNYEVSLIVPQDSEDDFLNRLSEARIKVVKGDFNAFGARKDNSLNQIKQILDIAKKIEEENPTIFLTNLYLRTGGMAAALKNIPHIYFDRGAVYSGNEMFVKEDIKYSNMVVANSKKASELFKNTFNVESETIYSYVPRPISKLQHIKKPRIIVPSRISEEKGQLEILKAINTIKKHDSSFETKVLFIGAVSPWANSYYKELQNFIKKNKLTEYVRFINHTKDPWQHASENDIYINASRIESVGRSTAEAEMLGITALITNIPGHWEHEHFFGNKNKFKLQNASDLTEKIIYLLSPENQEMIRKENKKIKNSILSWMTPDNTMSRILPVMDQLSGQDNPAKERIYTDLQSIIDQSLNDATSKELYIEHLKNEIIIMKDKNNSLLKEHNKLLDKINSYSSIKKSAKLLKDNIRRRIKGRNKV